MRRKYQALLLSFCLLFIHNAMLFSQEQAQSKVLPYRPASSDLEGFKLEARIDLEKKFIKSCGFYSDLLKYVALRKDDLSVCPTAKCKQDVDNDLLFIRYQAEGKCEKIKVLNNQPFQKELCVALNANDCNQLADWKKDYCVGIINNDIDSVVKVFMSVNKKKEDKATAEVLHMLGIYWGFKYYNSATACEKYMGQISINNRSRPLYKRLACAILFYPDAERTFDEVLRDLSIFSLSRKEKRDDICSLIRDPKIKEACLSKAFEELQDLFD